MSSRGTVVKLFGTLHDACVAEIVARCLRGEWDGFYDSYFRDDILAAFVKGLKDGPDADVQIGTMALELEPMAKAYADEYVTKHGDPEDLAIDLGVVDLEDAA